MFNLPIELQRRIYEYDPTYREIMNDIIKKDLPDHLLKNHPHYPYLMSYLDSVNYDYDNAMYFFVDDGGEPQMSFIDDDLNHLTDNFATDGDVIVYKGTDITYLLEPYMSDSEYDTDEDLQFFIEMEVIPD